MAKCTYKLPDDFLKKISSLGKRMDEVSEKVLQAGGEVVLKNTKTNLQSSLSGDSTVFRRLGLIGRATRI